MDGPSVFAAAALFKYNFNKSFIGIEWQDDGGVHDNDEKWRVARRTVYIGVKR